LTHLLLQNQDDYNILESNQKNITRPMTTSV